MASKSHVALIALGTAEFASVEKLQTALQAEGGDYPPVEVRQRDNTTSFLLGDDKVVITAVAEPIPWTDLTGPCEAAWYWPEAASELRKHRAHLMVVVVPGGPDRKSAAIKLTKVAAALVQSSPALGVFWGGSGTVHAPGPFCQTAGEASPERLPVEIWVGFGLIPESDQTHSVYTSGLEDFGMQELEVHRSVRDPQFLYERLFDVVHYVLRKDVILKEGETIGISEEEQIPIEEIRSLCDGKTKVLHLAL